jgi:hypothetical protein
MYSQNPIKVLIYDPVKKGAIQSYVILGDLNISPMKLGAFLNLKLQVQKSCAIFMARRTAKNYF